MRTIIVATVLAAVIASGCSPSLSDAEKVWCGSNTAPVSKAAHALDLENTEPELMRYAAAKYDTYIIDDNLGVRLLKDEFPDSYSRACKAAYENR